MNIENLMSFWFVVVSKIQNWKLRMTLYMKMAMLYLMLKMDAWSHGNNKFLKKVAEIF